MNFRVDFEARVQPVTVTGVNRGERPAMKLLVDFFSYLIHTHFNVPQLCER